MRFGIQTAINGCASPEVEKVVETCINKIYKQLKSNPIAICKPTPPRILREDIDTPIIVRIKVANGKDVRLYISTS